MNTTQLPALIFADPLSGSYTNAENVIRGLVDFDASHVADSHKEDTHLPLWERLNLDEISYDNAALFYSPLLLGRKLHVYDDVVWFTIFDFTEKDLNRSLDLPTIVCHFALDQRDDYDTVVQLFEQWSAKKQKSVLQACIFEHRKPSSGKKM